MRRRYLAPLLFLCAAFAPPAGNPAEPARLWPNGSFGTGEVLRYKVHYGVLNAGEATIETSRALERVADRPCYRATVSGHTTGSVDYFMRVRDTWRCYIDTASILPLRSSRDIAEGSYRKKEVVDFDHARDQVSVVQTHVDPALHYTFKTPHNVQELVSGFYFLRTLDFDRMKPGDIIRVGGFFDEGTFNLEVAYRGREIVETKAGLIHAFKLVPKMPKNRIFRGEEAIKVYFSDDKNKIPVLFQAEMFVGAVKVDMYKADGLKARLNMAK